MHNSTLETIKPIKEELDAAKCTIHNLENTIKNMELQICDLSQTNERLKEENVSFMKVSQIVAYEKENARLKRIVEDLDKKLKKVHEATIVNETTTKHVVKNELVMEATTVPQNKKEEMVVTKDETINDENEAEEAEEEEEEEEGEDFYEKTIKGKKYYLTDEKTPKVFEIDKDGNVGSFLGIYESGKIKRI
jgi:glucan-binding YG repeat protein